jgi:hypothetical protein
VLQFSCYTTSLNSGVRSSNSSLDGWRWRWLRWALHAQNLAGLRHDLR